MKVIDKSLAGTLESSDIQIILMPAENGGIEIELKSSVEKQFGRQIRKIITETLGKLQIENVKVIAVDNGALDCTIRARVECAAYRACGIKEKYDWEVID
ncbi:MAG TPA: citrate lyase acyl carrier protein [Clostridiaceae bacterium]|mgnify:CR=1 FL=1|jgi:citrate lyase subunit gamma (acyl carrier protein)|nr:citrate lyase acyl carrier protein [Clostridiaceae bacterium]HBF77947.1 citrate lyase acyl carrier protein [Clostridiaceae bacterium]HBG38307.1 citrate lyase acyl carrier protein [Clostridiaceae bacterium]HBN28015.1 citrate lyase acyl carrier protein [Clostridiaceae bacterium]HBX48699.1 citrate lyase acyl carrier protein [Clostridiaceae bacterium]